MVFGVGWLCLAATLQGGAASRHDIMGELNAIKSAEALRQVSNIAAGYENGALRADRAEDARARSRLRGTAPDTRTLNKDSRYLRDVRRNANTRDRRGA
ncbi:hypothetical protein M885DRAFT_535051 [Pelagophyceae sp. CCMP2097]|nr:hypothetical protein M885DRAFT_535051 [Pelagophyceae sp. CCMP2097]